MSKSVIVIDTPKTCAECRASYCADVWYCYAGEYRKILTSKEIYAKPDWCPLKPLPEKRQVDNEGTNYGQEPYFSDGWNACIEYLEGEKRC